MPSPRSSKNNGFFREDKTAEPVNTGCNHQNYKYPRADWCHTSCLRAWVRIANTCPICRPPRGEPPVLRVPSLLDW